MRAILVISLFSTVLAKNLELTSESVFGGQTSQKISYENSIDQQGLPFPSIEGNATWYEPFCMTSFISPWQSAFLQTNLNYKLSPYDFSYKFGIGGKFFPYLSIFGHYTQDFYFAKSNDLPWYLSRKQIDSAWHDDQVRESIDYFPNNEIDFYQSFGLAIVLHGNLPKYLGQLPWKINIEHTFVDRNGSTENRLYDYNLRLPLSKNDELLSIEMNLDWKINPQWSIGVEYSSIINLLQSGVISHGEILDPKQKRSLARRLTGISLDYHTQSMGSIGLFTGFEDRNTNENISELQNLRLGLNWIKTWSWQTGLVEH